MIDNKKAESQRLTASEARRIAGRSLDEKIDAILEAIRRAANEKKRVLATGWDHKEDEDLWIQGGYGRTDDWKTAVEILEDLGYKVTFFYEECQFVNMYTKVEW